MKLTRFWKPSEKTYTLAFEITKQELAELNLSYDFQRVWKLNQSRRTYINFLQRFVAREQQQETRSDYDNLFRKAAEKMRSEGFDPYGGQGGYTSEPFRSKFENAQRIFRDEPPPIPEPAWCKVLDLPRTATQDEIKKQYRKLAHKYHPDKGGDPVRFNQINRAYNEATKG